jgi:hypothetical protein
MRFALIIVLICSTLHLSIEIWNEHTLLTEFSQETEDLIEDIEAVSWPCLEQLHRDEVHAEAIAPSWALANAKLPLPDYFEIDSPPPDGRA